jgi:hypothetical protein
VFAVIGKETEGIRAKLEKKENKRSRKMAKYTWVLPINSRKLWVSTSVLTFCHIFHISCVV